LKISPRAAITLTFIAFGAIIGAQIGAIPTLKQQAGISDFMFGVLSGLATACTILAMSFAGKVSKRFDNRSVILFILPLATVAVFANLLANSMVLFAVTFMVLSFCMGTLDVFMNAEASIVERDLGKPVFSSFHAAVLYAIGAGGLAGGYIAVTFGSAWAIILGLPFAALAIYAVNASIAPHVAETSDKSTNVKLPKKVLAIIGMIIGLDVAAELTCIQWSGQLLAELQPSLAQYSGLGVAFYGLCNGTMRLFGDRLRARFDDMTLIIVSLLIGITGFAFLSTTPGFAGSVIAFAIVGCGLALIFPCLFSIAARLAPHARPAALGFASAVSGPPRILLPIILGLIAQNFGLNAINLAAGLACLAAIGFALWAKKEMPPSM
jgi:MFS family permease